MITIITNFILYLAYVFITFFSKQKVQSFLNASKPIDSVIFDRNLLYDLSPKGKFIPFIEMRVYSFLELVLLPI